MAANMNGRDYRNVKVEKMLHPHWFELAHAKWPDAHFDYFLAQMRGPGETLLHAVALLGPGPDRFASRVASTGPQLPGPRAGLCDAPGRRGPAYWESPAPAVAFQLSTYYVHYAHDSFSLLGFYAFNRPIYLNRQISNGYGGGCPGPTRPAGMPV